MELQRWSAKSTTSKSTKTFGNRTENGQDLSILSGCKSKIFQTLSSFILRTLWTKTDLLARVETAKKSTRKLERKCSAYSILLDRLQSSSMISNFMMSKRNSDLFETSIKAHITTKVQKKTQTKMQQIGTRLPAPPNPSQTELSQHQKIPTFTSHLNRQLSHNQSYTCPLSILNPFLAHTQVLQSVPCLSVQHLQLHHNSTILNKNWINHPQRSIIPILSKNPRTWSGCARKRIEKRRVVHNSKKDDLN